MENKLFAYKGITPKVHDQVFIANGTCIVGDVTIASHSSIWFNTVIRGDVNSISIGKYTNVQDNSTIHVMSDGSSDGSTVIGDHVTIGHGTILHACRIADNCLIGMGSIVLSYAEIGENCLIGAGTLITENKKIPPNSLVMGSPGKVVRTLTEEEIKVIKETALDYYAESLKYRFER